MPENPASYRVVRTKSYLFNKAIQREKRQAKIKKTSGRYFQQRNLCYWQFSRIKTLLICKTQWETMPANEKNFLLCDQYVSD
ncbi:hypothetical protein FXN98_06990 [Klebsiella pneumoniae]|nr:hypothetical protein FXN98_06990 [Klebsiella pneumoniae]